MQESERFEKACAHFNDKEYFEAHEEWEELWYVASGPRHAYLQGLIQVAVALHHAQNGNIKGCRKLLARSLVYLERSHPSVFEIDVEKIRERVLDFELSLQALGRGEGGELPFFELPRR